MGPARSKQRTHQQVYGQQEQGGPRQQPCCSERQRGLAACAPSKSPRPSGPFFASVLLGPAWHTTAERLLRWATAGRAAADVLHIGRDAMVLLGR